MGQLLSQLGEYSGNRNLPNTCNIMNSSELPIRSSLSDCTSRPVVRQLLGPYVPGEEEDSSQRRRKIHGISLFSAKQLLKQKSSREIEKIRSKLTPHWDPDIFMAVVLQLARRDDCECLQAELRVTIADEVRHTLMQRFSFSNEIDGAGTTLSGILTLDEDRLLIPCLLDPPNDFGGLFTRATEDREQAIEICRTLGKRYDIRY